MSRLSMRRSPPHIIALPNHNQLLQNVEIGKHVGRYGPGFIWNLFDAIESNTRTKCTTFICDKKLLDRMTKNKRREGTLEILRNDLINLNKLKHPRFLLLIHDVEENNEYLTFVTEPVIGSLADMYIDDKESSFCELEIIFGIHQITDALRYLHSTQELMHCNINLASILLVNKSIWKLGGLNFLEKIVDTTKINPRFTGYSVKLPFCAQPDLDFIAPEAQMYNSMSPLADMFSLGMVVCAIYNHGRSLIDSEQNPSVYVKQLPEIQNGFERICERLPKVLLEPVRKMISQDVRERPTSQLFALLKVFNEPTVLSYEGLLTLNDKTVNQKKEFLSRLTKVIPLFEPIVRYKYILPLILQWLYGSNELSPYVLPSFLTMIKVAESDDHDKYLKIHLHKILTETKSLQTSMIILDHSDLFINHISQEDISNLLVPELSVCLEPGTPKSLETVQNAISVLSKYLSNTQIVQSILPQLKEIYQRKTSNPKIRIACLECLGKLLKNLTMSALCDDLLPFISSIRTVDRELVLAVVALNRQLISDRSNEISYTYIAGMLLPSMVNFLALKTLTISDFRAVISLTRTMLDLIDRQRSIELRSQIGSKSVGGSCSDMSSSLGVPRNLPLIAMQRPTIDSELLYVDMDDPKLSRSSLDYRRSSGSEMTGTNRWSRNSLLIQRLQASKHRSESLLFNTKHRNSIGDHRFWNETVSNPNFNYHGHSSTNSRIAASPSYILSPSCGDFYKMRRYSGNILTRSTENQVNTYDHLGSLNVPRYNNGFLDPRRHSYGFTPSTSTKSLITVNVCEGPFVTPLNYRGSIRRNSGWSCGQFPTSQVMNSTEEDIQRRSSLNVIGDMLISTFKKVL
ncbi:SCY1-like protein isoform 1 [Schistosoma japonicum]|uniref:SCY1-like protein isoform 1 n=1 Tax=Schistosoma japonicum TaxID=6182 RepID=A0A4Z2CYW1_SCHJA|nr:SCY1-like protein isoform 1 [Schistosoma japonicum]